jgi:hypothetical protein
MIVMNLEAAQLQDFPRVVRGEDRLNALRS